MGFGVTVEPPVRAPNPLMPSASEPSLDPPTRGKASGPGPLAGDPENCPFAATLRVDGGKWKEPVWRRLSRGRARLGELHRSIPRVSRKMLIQQLRELEREGIVHRDVHAEVPPRVEYSLTDHGRSLREVMEVGCAWGARHLKRARECQRD